MLLLLLTAVCCRWLAMETKDHEEFQIIHPCSVCCVVATRKDHEQFQIIHPCSVWCVVATWDTKKSRQLTTVVFDNASSTRKVLPVGGNNNHNAFSQHNEGPVSTQERMVGITAAGWILFIIHPGKDRNKFKLNRQASNESKLTLNKQTNTKVNRRTK